MASLLAAGVLLLASGTGADGRGHRAGPPATQSVFAAVDATASGGEIELRSASTGRVLKRLATIGAAFTNNGFAVAPDRSQIYFTLIPQHGEGLVLNQLSTATRKQSVIGRGEDPAVSPDSQRLAYVTDAGSGTRVVVREIATGHSDSVDVSHLLGPANTLGDGTLQWFGDGSRLAVFPGSIAIPTAGGGFPGQGGRHGVVPFLIVDLLHNGRLRAWRRKLPGTPHLPFVIGTDPARVNSLLLAFLPQSRTVIERLWVGAKRTTLRPVVTLHGEVRSFDPHGQRILFQQGRAGIWRAGIARGRLINTRKVLQDANLIGLAW